MPIVVLDTETTGMDPHEDKLVELAGIRLLKDPSEDIQFSTLCDPGRGISPSAMGIHHITEEMTRGQPTPEQAVQNMVSSLSLHGPDNYFVAHNAKFDRGMMASLALPPVTWICTLRCAQMIWPEAPDYKNQTLRYWLGLKPQVPPDLAPHRALYDIICTAEIFRTMLKLVSFDDMIYWSNNLILLPKVTFGKHRGKTWAEVDRGYLRWCINQSDIEPDVKFTAEHWMRK